MVNYVKFELTDGTLVYMETNESNKGGSGLIPTHEAALDTSAHSFEQAIDGVRKMAAVMIDSFHNGIEEPPSEVSISFGLRASAEVGALTVGRGVGQDNINVSLRWYKKDEEDKKEKEDKEDKEEKAEKETENQPAAEK